MYLRFEEQRNVQYGCIGVGDGGSSGDRVRTEMRHAGQIIQSLADHCSWEGLLTFFFFSKRNEDPSDGFKQRGDMI